MKPQVGMPVQFFEYDGAEPLAATIVDLYENEAMPDHVDLVVWSHFGQKLVKRTWIRPKQDDGGGWRPIPTEETS